MYFFYFRTFSYLCIYNSCLFHVFLVFNIMMSCILNAMKAVLILLLSRTHPHHLHLMFVNLPCYLVSSEKMLNHKLAYAIVQLS